MMTDAEHLHRWAVDRAIIGDGRKLAYVLDAKVKDLEEHLAIVTEQCDVACDRAQSWKNLCEHYKELAEARGEALAKQRGPRLDPHGRGSVLAGHIIDAEASLKMLLVILEDVKKELPA